MKLKQVSLMLQVTLLWAVLFAGCSTPAKDNKKVFHLNLSSGKLESIDPAYAKDLYTMWIDHMVYNTLFETGESLELIPSLATRFTVSADGLTYTFRIRQDVFFHNNPAFPGGKGRSMNAGDVVYSFNRLVDPATASSGAWIFNDRIAAADAFTAPDDTTFVIKLKAPFRPLIQILTMPYCSIVPHEVVEKWGKDYRAHPCGTGPFAMDSWDEGNALILHRNARYWERDSAGKALPYLDAVQVGFVDSKATEFLLFTQGKLDFINNLDGSFKDQVLYKNGTLKEAYRKQFRLTMHTYLNNEYIGFLTDTLNPLVGNSPLKDPLVRQAFNYAIDRQKICTYFRNGVTLPATSGFIPPGMPGHDSSGSFGYHYDPEKAMSLLAKAGYPGGKGMEPITILTPDNYIDIVNFIVSELKDVGIPAKAEAMQANILRQQMSSSKALMFRAQWIADYPDAETYMAFFNGRLPAPPNYTRFSNKQFDEWYDQSLNTPDSARGALYRKMDSLVTSYAPVLDVFYDRLLHFTSLRVSGFRSTPMNLIDIKMVDVTQDTR